MNTTVGILAVALMTTNVAAGTQQAAPTSSAKPDAARGKMLFEKTLRCYACHGF